MKKKLSQKTMDHLKHLKEIQTYIAENHKKNLKEVMLELWLDYKTHRSLMANNEKYRKWILYAKSERWAKRIAKHHILWKVITHEKDTKKIVRDKGYKKWLLHGILITIAFIVFFVYFISNFYYLAK